MVDQQRRRLSWGGAVPLLYRLLVVAGVSGDGSPGGRMGVPLGTARFVLGFGNAGEEDRTATLRALQLDDYTCWMLPIAMNSTVCIKVIVRGKIERAHRARHGHCLRSTQL